MRTIFALVNGSAGATGIIGRRVGAAIGALPSDAYWSGLSNWAIRTFEGSQRDYLTAALSDDGFPGLPESPPGIYESTNIRLTSEEADFLEQRVLTTHPESFLARCLLGRKDPNSGQMPWDHAEATNLSPPLTRQLHHAELFSVATWGAGLALNRTVADLRAADRGALGTPVLEWNIAAWLETVRLNQSSLRAWDRDDLWHLVEEKTFVPHHTRRFVNQWLDLVLTQPVAVVDPSPQVLNMLRAREHQLKGPRARLVSQRARETNTGLQGTDPLNYRWGNAARIITDIRRGLR